MSNEKLQKIDNEIIRTKSKISILTAKVRKLESDKTAIKQAEFLAIINGADISSEELMALIQAQKAQYNGNTEVMPNTPSNNEANKNDMEDNDENI